MSEQATNGRPPTDIDAGALDGKVIHAGLPAALDREVDRLVERGHAQNRSHAVREALREYLDGHPASEYTRETATADQEADR